MSVLADTVLAALPQTQCTRCGYPDCAGYAQAVATGAAAINQCPPGGLEGVQRLAAITGQPVLPLNPQFGLAQERSVAYIDENWCIGCTLCIKACPVDAIFGSNKFMHSVLEAHCTGCELCLPACPVDCIVMEPVTPGQTGWAAWSAAQADAARDRYQFFRSRHNTLSTKPAHRGLASDTPQAPPPLPTPDKKDSVIAAALARARQQRGTN